MRPTERVQPTAPEGTSSSSVLPRFQLPGALWEDGKKDYFPRSLNFTRIKLLVLLYPPERDAVNPATVKSFPLFAPHFVRSCLDFSLLEEILHIFSRENHARFKSSSPSPLILGLSRKMLGA